MLQRSISILATTAVLLHSVFGCCWHHAHAADHVTGLAETASGHGPVGHQCHAHSSRDTHHPGHVVHHQNDGPREPHAPCQRNPCDGDACHFAPTAHIKVPGPDDSRLTDSTIVARTVQPGCGTTVGCLPCVAPAESTTRCYARVMTQIWLL